MRTPRALRLYAVVATVELLIGIAIYAVPDQFNPNVYLLLQPIFPLMSTGFLLGGILLLIALRYSLKPWLMRLLVIVPAAPLLALTVGLTYAHVWTGTLVYGPLATALIIAPWLPKGDGRIDLSEMVMGWATLSSGLMLLLVPELFPSVTYYPVLPIQAPLGVGGIVAGAIVLAAPLLYRGGLPFPIRVVVAIPALALTYNWIATGVWSGMVIWSAVSLVILGVGARSNWRLAPGDEAPFMERLVETWIWGSAVLVVLLSAIGGVKSVASPLLAHVLVITLIAYNSLVYLIGRLLGSADRRVIIHLLFLTLTSGLILIDPGPMGHSFLVPLVVIPAVAARVQGARTGWQMLLLGAIVLILSQVGAGLLGYRPWTTVLGLVLVKGTFLALAAYVGIRMAADANRSLLRLRETSETLANQVTQMELIDQIGAAIRQSLRLDETLHTTVTEMARALNVDRCLIRLRGSDGSYPILVESTAEGIGPLAGTETLPMNLLLLAAHRQAIIAIDDVSVVPDPTLAEPLAILATLGARSWLSAPLIANGQILGVMSFHQCRSTRRWTPRDIAFVEAVSSQAAVAISHARAHSRLAQLGAMIDATPDLVAILDQAGRATFLNAAARRMLGLESDAPIEQIHYTDILVHPSPTPWAPPQRAPRKEEARWRTASGESVPVSQVVVPLPHSDAGGYAAVLARDVRDLRRAQEVLRASETRFRVAFNESPVGMAVTTPDGEWLMVNQALCRMVGREPAELASVRWEDLTDPSDLERELPLLKRAIAGETNGYQIEKRYFHADGHWFWIQLTVSLVRSETGDPVYILCHVQDIHERRLNEQRLVHMAHFDELTDLLNRRALQEELTAAVALSQQNGTQGALLFLDLDDFKDINDLLGHSTGDQLLCGIARAVQRGLPAGSSVARLGGDEFAILLPQAAPEQAFTAAQAVVKGISQYTLLVQGRPVRVTGSVGVVIFPDHGVTAEELLARADIAMYQGKAAGRNRYQVFKPSDMERRLTESRMGAKERILDALANDRFALFLQPILNLATDRVSQYEALLRITSETGEIIMPGAFISAAERSGLIHEIDRWVVRRAIQLLSQWQRQGGGISLEVNLSGMAFSDPLLLPTIQRELTLTGVDPTSLILEITETSAISDMTKAKEFVETLKQIGCRFALDDFGSGFASFLYLKHLPIDYLKIDGSFIQNLCHDRADQLVVRALVETARGLGRRTIAEFVEDASTMAMLREIGVDFAQGYHIGRPAPSSVHLAEA